MEARSCSKGFLGEAKGSGSSGRSESGGGSAERSTLPLGVRGRAGNKTKE